MNEVLGLAGEALSLAIRLSLPILLVALVTGLITGVLQSVTQVQDQALSYVPRLLAILLALWLLGPGMMRDVCEFSRQVMVRACHISSAFGA